MRTLFILDRNKKIVDVLFNGGKGLTPFFDDTFTQEINAASTFEFTTIVNERTMSNLKVRNYILFKRNNKNYLFSITETETNHDEGCLEMTTYCESVSLILYNSIVPKTTINNCNLNTFLTTVLQDTDFKVGDIDKELNKAFLIDLDGSTSVYETIIQHLEDYGAELDIRIETSGSEVTGMYIDMKKRLGTDNGARFEYSRELNNVKRKENAEDLCTAIIGKGKNDLDFREAEWSIEAGKPADKPRGANFIADDFANAMYGVPQKYIYGVYEDSDCEDPYTLLEKSYEALQERKNPKIDYECDVALLSKDIELGDSVRVIDRTYPEPLMLTARVNKLEISFTDESQNTCEFSNYSKAYSNMISKYDPYDKLKDYLLNLGIGKLTPAEILAIKQYMMQLGIEKDLIDRLFSEITGNNPEQKPDEGNTTTNNKITTLEGGLWIGDSRMVSMRKYNMLKVESTQNTNYTTALALYQTLGVGNNVKSQSSEYEKVISSSNKYKISTMVKYWAGKFGLDVNLVYAVIMAESGGDPYNATKNEKGAYGIMQCERSVYFNQPQTIKFLDGTKKSFTPSYSTMRPGDAGSTTINGIAVDKNISNQIMFGCYELRYAIDFARQNIFAGLIAYNMGVGAMSWIISKYVCDTYNYTFVNKNSITAQSSQVQKKAYEVLENGGFEFADWRKKYIENGGGGTVNNVEGYVAWYKIENGQLPYTYDLNGNKFGYGVSDTKITTTIPISTSTELTTTRNKIIAKAKEIVQLHLDSKASYSQVPRTIDDTKRVYIKKGSRVKMNSKGKYQTIGSTYYGISTSANDGKGIIAYDCSSFASCCYMAAGLKSMYNGNCSGGSIMDEIVNNGGMMWLANAEGRKKAIPGDCVMFADGKNPTQNDMDKRKLLATHHVAVYIGDDQIAHASKWAEVPDAIKISKLSTYKTLASAFFIRPKDLQQTDTNEPTISDETTDVNNNIISKCVIGASAYHFYKNSQLLKTVQVGSYSDTTEYPSSVPYIFVHLGVNDPYESGYNSLKILLSLLQTKYPNVPIFVARELHVGSAMSNYVEYNKAIDTFNTEIAEYCNEHEYVYQINISTDLEENGILKSLLTNDGVHLKTKDNYQVLFNNIKNKIVVENSGSTGGSTGGDDDTGNDDTVTTKPSGKSVEVVLQSTQNYYYDKLKSLYFKLPSKVVNSYYSRLKFTTTDNFTYTQSKICYLEGEDCVAGQLVPKPDTIYKIIIMANVNTSINYKYYGSVSVDKAGDHTVEYTFKGGEKVAEIAKTYLNQTGLEYRGQYSTTAKYTPASYSNPYKNLSKWYDSSRKKAQIDCSTLTKFAYMGIDYDHSPYKNHKMTSVKRNTSYSWAFTFPRTAAEQAEYCVKNGWVLHDVDISNYSNLKAGDIVFWDRDNGENGRYMNCSHAAIVIGQTDDGGTVYTIESTQCENGVKTRLITDNKTDKILFVARPKKV